MTILAYQHFLQQASQRLRDEYQLGRRNAVLIINFERLIELDGILGFTIVDNTLQQIAQQLRNALNPDDLVGITGRYQICCLLVDLLTDAHAMLAAHKILRILTPPFVLDRKNIILAPRLGVAVNNASGDKLDQLMCNASAAVRQAKLEQLPSKLFHAEMQDPLLFQIDLWSDLGNAIENGGLYLGYQPQIDIASGKIKSTEALLRWHHPHHGPIRTDKLIQVAEGTPLMSKLTLWVFPYRIKGMF